MPPVKRTKRLSDIYTCAVTPVEEELIQHEHHQARLKFRFGRCAFRTSYQEKFMYGQSNEDKLRFLQTDPLVLTDIRGSVRYPQQSRLDVNVPLAEAIEMLLQDCNARTVPGAAAILHKLLLSKTRQLLPRRNISCLMG